MSGPVPTQPADEPIGTVRSVDGHVFVKLGEPVEEPWHIAFCEGEQNMSGWQSDECMVGSEKWGGYLPVLECGRPSGGNAPADAEDLATIDERDAAEEWADRLAYAIAPESAIGVHSSDNNPWQNALDLISSPGWGSAVATPDDTPAGGIKLPAIVRPNGKTYQPRRIAVESWENDDASDGWNVGAIVFGTHDIDFARPLATEAICRYDDGMVALGATAGWFRDGYEHGERIWVDDEVRGRAGVWFRGDYPPASPVGDTEAQQDAEDRETADALRPGPPEAST